MSDLGLSIDWAVAVAPRYSINIASSACSFVRVAHALSRDLGILHISHLDSLCDSFIEKLWKEFLSFLVSSGERVRDAAAASGSPSSALNVHSLTCQFIVSQVCFVFPKFKVHQNILQVLPLCEEIYEEDCTLLSDMLDKSFPFLKIFLNKEETSSFEEVANV